MIRWELKQKGVGEQEIASALEGVDDSQTAIEAARRRWPRVAALEPRERKRKLMEYLARNGFDYDTISNAVNQVLSEHNAAASDDGIEG